MSDGIGADQQFKAVHPLCERGNLAADCTFAEYLSSRSCNRISRGDEKCSRPTCRIKKIDVWIEQSVSVKSLSQRTLGFCDDELDDFRRSVVDAVSANGLRVEYTEEVFVEVENRISPIPRRKQGWIDRI